MGANGPGDRYPEGAAPFRPKAQLPIANRAFPVSRHLSDYPRRSLRHDAIAGVTVAALALPSAMAYAQLAGLSPVTGLYALLLPAVAYAILGSSRQLVVGPEGTLVLLVAAAVAPLAGHDPVRYAALAAMLAVLVGGCFLVARIVKLGWIADYLSRAVLVGFITGIAIVLIIGQLGKLFGLSIQNREPIPELREVIRELDGAQGLTIAIGLSAIVILLLIRRFAPGLPGPLIMVVAGIVASVVFDLQGRGVAVVGHIPAGLPSLQWPGVPFSDVVALVPAALGIFAVGFADGVLIARSFAGKNNQHVDANQELLALGTANLVAGVSQGFPIGASGSRTAVNDQMGGRTQVVGLVAAAVIAIVLLVLTGPVEKLPNAILGAIIVVAAIGLIDPAAWRSLARVHRMEVVLAAIAAIGVVTLGVLPAIGIAVALSIVDVVARSAHPHDAVLGWVERLGRYADVSMHPSARVTPGIVVYRLDDRLIFTNSRYVVARVGEAIVAAPSPTRWLVFDAEGVTNIDASGVDALGQLVTRLEADGITLTIARIKGPMVRNLDDAGFLDRIGHDRLYPTVRAAVEACPGPGPGAGAAPGESPDLG